MRVSKPHDALVKWTFTQPERAASELKAVLPPSLVSSLDWSSLALVPGSYVDSLLSERHTDLLFSIRTKHGDPANIYVLFEHQSSDDVLMPFRLLGYISRIWERWMKEHADTRTLPVVIPIVLHHSRNGWTAPTELAQLFAINPELKSLVTPFSPNFRFILDDLTHASDDHLRARATDALTTLVLLALRHGREDSGAHILEFTDLMARVLKAPDGPRALSVVLRYVLEVTQDVTADQIKEQLAPILGPGVEEAIMTAGQQLIEQGRQQGRQEGRLEGRQEGRLEGQRDLLVRLLHTKFRSVPSDVAEWIANADSELLESWTEKVLTAQKLSDVFST